jgi:Xaa-Pro aminopeptidase
MKAVYRLRIKSIQAQLPDQKLDAFVVTDRSNTRYLTGFTGTYSIFLLTCTSAHFITDSRYAERARQELSGLQVLCQPVRKPEQWLQRFFQARKLSTIGFEGTIAYKEYVRLRRAVRPARLRESSAIAARLRIKKGPQEIRHIKTSARIGEQALQWLLKRIHPGITEQELALGLRRRLEDLGSESEAFPSIIASGPHAAWPHAETSRRTVRRGDAVIIDLGAISHGYCSDMTRTIFVHTANRFQQKLYEIVREAQRRAIEAIRPGVAARAIDAIARGFIERHGYGKCFGHGLGHGVGLSVHEPPTLNPQSRDVLEPGMVITIEPGIYIPRRTGIRIEDLVLVTEAGYELLTQFPRDLIALK